MPLYKTEKVQVIADVHLPGRSFGQARSDSDNKVCRKSNCNFLECVAQLNRKDV